MTVLLLALSGLAAAAPKAKSAPAPCEAQTAALAEAAPQKVAAAFVELAACNAGLAKAAAATAFPRILAGKEADPAVVAALKLGAADTVRGWMDGLESDQRSAAVSALGESCAVAEVPAFFLAVSATENFTRQGWYKGLDDCRVPEAQALLKTRIQGSAGDRALFSNLLDVYGRNVGVEAIPFFEQLLVGQNDPELATYIVSSFGAAAGLGQPGGASTDAATKAIGAITKAAPTLPAKAVEQARNTLKALGAEQQSSAMAKYVHKEGLQADGRLQYGVFVTETATCKKGDTRIVAHHAPVLIMDAWPDEVGERVKAAVETFGFDLAEKCKGTGSNAVTTSPPLKDAAAYQGWVAEQLKELGKAQPAVKPKVEAETTLDL